MSPTLWRLPLPDSPPLPEYSQHIRIPLQDPPRTSGVEYLARSAPRPAQQKDESPLLKAVKGALRGQDTDPPSVIQTTWLDDADNPDGRELAWNANQVTLCTGGVLVKRWSFFQDKEDVQCACLGLVEQNALESQKHFTPAPSQGSVAEDDASDPPKESHPGQRPTFGPFAQRDFQRRQFSDTKKTLSAVFIFLRSVAKIYLQTGISYTVNVPFVVRRAWPLTPHGVLIQRVLEPSELEEAKLTGEPVLPTMFTITSPFQEPAAVGLAASLETSTDAPIKIHTEEPSTDAHGKPSAATNVLKSIPPTEMVLWVSHTPENQRIQPKIENNKSLVVTVDPQASKLSIWVYAYAENSLQQPQSTLAPSAPAVLSQVKSRQSSTIVNHNRRTSSAFEGERLDSKHASTSSSGLPASKDIGGLNQDGFPVVSLPSLSTAAGPATAFPSTQKTKSDSIPAAVDERMKATYWMECVAEVDIPEESAKWWRIMKVAVFDERFDGATYGSSIGVCFRDLLIMYVFRVELEGTTTQRFKAHYSGQYPAMTIASVVSTRPGIADLMAVTAEGRIYLLQGSRIILLNLYDPAIVVPQDTDPLTHPPYTGIHRSKQGSILDLDDVRGHSLTLRYQNGWVSRVHVCLIPNAELALDCLRVLSRALPEELYARLHTHFLQAWEHRLRTDDPCAQFDCVQQALSEVLDLERQENSSPTPETAWDPLGWTHAHRRCSHDIALRKLKRPGSVRGKAYFPQRDVVSDAHAAALFGLHLLGEALRLQKERRDDVVRLAHLLCHLALSVRPEWADYWMRLVPSAMEQWPDPTQYNIELVTDRLASSPPDATSYLSAILNLPYPPSLPRRLSPFPEITSVTTIFLISPGFLFGSQDPTAIIRNTMAVYYFISDPNILTAQKRAECAVQWLLSKGPGMELLDKLPMGVVIPIKEALRTCQLSPPSHWLLPMYSEIGRNDLAASASEDPENMFTEGYRPAKDFMNPTKPKPCIGKIVADAKAAAAGEVDATSGVELTVPGDFGTVRFSHDRRLEEAGRLLNSSVVATIKVPDRGVEGSERDQVKENQEHLARVAERTFALSYGRAMFTFGSVHKVTRESHAIPKLEYSLKILPLSITISPDPVKGPPLEAIQWAEFHNGVAAGLRISPTAKGVESSWITFNKPSELTPEHAGFLFSLGLTGHLKELMTWHTFQYLTPKHDLTSIAVLLGLAASNIGRGTQKVVKLLAVHTPALLPTPNVDLNVSLLTQAAGLSALGILYLGMKNRRMAEVCLGEISRKDLVQQDLSNEHREAYTFSAAIAFGMIMLGKGSLVPADLDLVQRLTILLRGDVTLRVRDKPINPFDINLTSPAAAIALGLMYLRTERQDIADILTIPDTTLSLNRIQPSFLMIRTIARGLIMWEKVQPTPQWVLAQIPEALRDAVAPAAPGTAKAIEDAHELAYYHISAGCCFVLGLKYAGTARHEAFLIMSKYYDLFARFVFTANGPVYDQKIKRAALRDGLSLISVSLSMLMAGTGEVAVLRRIRQAYGMFQNNMYHPNFRYGVHVTTMQSLGLLFLGGGTSTLGTSDAAIACMVAAFFPRWHVSPSDNKCYLQALRHLWVLAVEPRCLVARDVDTGEVVFLPVKITVKEGDQVGTSQLISPTLIPDIDKLVSIRVDTPRYWPFYLDTSAQPRHREALLKNQTLYVKRRTAFLSYTEDPRGSRSLFVRSGATPGDAAILDFPESIAIKDHPGSDISEFITSFSNNIAFLAFADLLCRSDEEDGAGEDEKLFHSYCHSALLDCILQDKPQTLQTHLALYHYRHALPESKFFNLLFHDMRIAADFYGRVYERKFSGKMENNPRPGLVRDTAVVGALHSMERPLEAIRGTEAFLRLLGRYVRNEVVRLTEEERTAATAAMARDADGELSLEPMLAWYLLKTNMPTPVVLASLKEIAQTTRAQCLQDLGGEQGDPQKMSLVDIGIREAMHMAGSRMVPVYAPWSSRSLEEYMHSASLPR